MIKHPFKHYPEIFVTVPPCLASNIQSTNELPIYSMSALDEITLRIPDSLFNGIAVVTLIENCIPELKYPWKLPYFALNYLLIAIRIATNGENIDQSVVCPKCKSENEYSIGLSSTLEALSSIKIPDSIQIDDFNIEFKSIDYKHYVDFCIMSFNNQKMIMQLEKEKTTEATKQIADSITSLQHFWASHNIARITFKDVQYATFNEIQNILMNCDRSVFIKIQKIISTVTVQLNPEIAFECADCHHKFSSELNLDYGSMFRNQILRKTPEEIQKLVLEYEKDIEMLKYDILNCAWHMRGGVSYTELLHMSHKDRKIIGKISDEHIKITKESKQPYF